MNQFEQYILNPEAFNFVYQSIGGWTTDHINEVHQMD